MVSAFITKKHSVHNALKIMLPVRPAAALFALNQKNCFFFVFRLENDVNRDII